MWHCRGRIWDLSLFWATAGMDAGDATTAGKHYTVPYIHWRACCALGCLPGIARTLLRVRRGAPALRAFRHPAGDGGACGGLLATMRGALCHKRARLSVGLRLPVIQRTGSCISTIPVLAGFLPLPSLLSSVFTNFLSPCSSYHHFPFAFVLACLWTIFGQTPKTISLAWLRKKASRHFV